MSRRRRALVLAACLLVPWSAAAEGPGNHVDVTAVTIEGDSAVECAARIDRVAAQSRALSLATSPPHGMAEGLRTFYDHVLRLDTNGELSSTAQLSTIYVVGYGGGGERILRSVSPFVRVEVSRPPGTPAEASSRIAVSWLWLQRLSQANDPANRVIERPFLHRFDFVGELVPTYGTWGSSIAPCRAGTDGKWFGAVTVWTYLPP